MLIGGWVLYTTSLRAERSNPPWFTAAINVLSVPFLFSSENGDGMGSNFNPKYLSLLAISASIVGLLLVFKGLRFYDVDSITFSKYVISTIVFSLFFHVLMYFLNFWRALEFLTKKRCGSDSVIIVCVLYPILFAVFYVFFRLERGGRPEAINDAFFGGNVENLTHLCQKLTVMHGMLMILLYLFFDILYMLGVRRKVA